MFALLLVLVACRSAAERCAEGDPSMTASDCWYAGFDAGFGSASSDAYDLAYDSGYAACEADFDATAQ